MAKVFDVPADIFISRLTQILKNEDIPVPDWASFVKTGSHAEKPPQNAEWWHVRCASILRKIYLHSPASIKELRSCKALVGKRKCSCKILRKKTE